MATVADAIARIKACDVPSRFSLHLNGQGGGPFPAVPFGFDVSRSFALQSEVLHFTDPYMVRQ